MSDDDAECPNCGRTFSTRTRMKRHAESAHGAAPSDVPWRKIAAGVAIVALAVVGWTLVTGSGGGSAGSLAEEFAIADDPRLGNASAPVTVVAFESPACPACRS